MCKFPGAVTNIKLYNYYYYVKAKTASEKFPTKGEFQTSKKITHVYIESKISKSCSASQWSNGKNASLVR